MAILAEKWSKAFYLLTYLLTYLVLLELHWRKLYYEAVSRFSDSDEVSYCLSRQFDQYLEHHNTHDNHVCSQFMTVPFIYFYSGRLVHSGTLRFRNTGRPTGSFLLAGVFCGCLQRNNTCAYKYTHQFRFPSIQIFFNFFVYRKRVINDNYLPDH